MTSKKTTVLFKRVALIGIGLIGSSIAHRIKQNNLAEHISVNAKTEKSLKKVAEIGFADSITLDQKEVVDKADLIIICTPLGSYKEIIKNITENI